MVHRVTWEMLLIYMNMPSTTVLRFSFLQTYFKSSVLDYQVLMIWKCDSDNLYLSVVLLLVSWIGLLFFEACLFLNDHFVSNKMISEVDKSH